MTFFIKYYILQSHELECPRKGTSNRFTSALHLSQSPLHYCTTLQANRRKGRQKKKMPVKTLLFHLFPGALTMVDCYCKRSWDCLPFSQRILSLYVSLQEWFGPAVSVGGTFYPFLFFLSSCSNRQEAPCFIYEHLKAHSYLKGLNTGNLRRVVPI